jgi:hypothetical protein
MHFSKGKSTDAKGRVVKTRPAVKGVSQGQKNGPADEKDRLGKSIRIALASGLITCARREHYRMEKKDKEYTELVAAKAASIIKRMQPGAKASCLCEENACEEAWNWNTIGLFQDQYVLKGNHFKGVGDYKNDTKKRVMPVHFALSKDKLVTLHEKFPMWHFACTDTGGHDHPVSHVANQVACYQLMRKLKDGMWLDIFGNPASNSAWNNDNKNKARITSFVDICTPKDVIRSRTKWAGHDYVNGKRLGLKFFETEQDKVNLSVYQGLVGHHVLYYLTEQDIFNTLIKTDKKMLHATMHKFDKDSGTHSDGEQTWSKTDNGKNIVVKQTNSGTGEFYQHPDNSHWFDKQIWYPKTFKQHCEDNAITDTDAEIEKDGGLTWTINKDSDDVYVFTITPSPWFLQVDDVKPVIKEPKINTLPWVSKYECVWLYDNKGYKMKSIPVPLEGVKLFAKIRSKMPDRARNQKNLSTIYNHAKMALKDFPDLETIDFVNIVNAAFWVDMPDENSMIRFNAEMNLEFNKKKIIKEVVKDSMGLVATFIRNTKGMNGILAASADFGASMLK